MHVREMWDLNHVSNIQNNLNLAFCDIHVIIRTLYTDNAHIIG